MAYTFVNQVSAGSTGGDGVTTGAVDMTVNGGADLIVLIVSAYESNSANLDIQDSSSNSYTPSTPQEITGDVYHRIYFKQGPTVTSSMTFTANGTDTFSSIIALGFKGSAVDFTDVSDGEPIASATSLQPGSITPNFDDTLIVAGICFGAVNTVGINSDFIGSGGVNTVYEVDFSSSNHYGVAAAYKIQTSAAAVNPTFSWSSSCGAACSQGNFRAAADTPRRFILTGH